MQPPAAGLASDRAAAYGKCSMFKKMMVRAALGLTVLTAVPLAALAQSATAPVKIAMIEGLSGPFGNTGEAVFRNLVWAVERINARGGVTLALARYDSKGQAEEALSALKSAIDDGARFIMQGNSSATAAALTGTLSTPSCSACATCRRRLPAAAQRRPSLRFNRFWVGWVANPAIHQGLATAGAGFSTLPTPLLRAPTTCVGSKGPPVAAPVAPSRP